MTPSVHPDTHWLSCQFYSWLGILYQNLFYVRGKDGQNEVTTHQNVLFFFFTLAVSFLIRGAGKDDIFSHLVGISYFYRTQLLKNSSVNFKVQF